MSVRAFIIGCLLSNSVGACTYDEANQLAKLAELKNSIVGSSLNKEAREVAWTGTDGKKYSITYGGCDHLGHRITVTEANGVPATKPELFRIWQELADAYWWTGENVILKRALEASEYTSESSGSGVRYDVVGTDYAEMYLESRQEGAVVVVTVAWVRTF